MLISSRIRWWCRKLNLDPEEVEQQAWVHALEDKTFPEIKAARDMNAFRSKRVSELSQEPSYEESSLIPDLKEMCEASTDPKLKRAGQIIDMLSKGCTQKECAEYLGCSTSAISQSVAALRKAMSED